MTIIAVPVYVLAPNGARQGPKQLQLADYHVTT